MVYNPQAVQDFNSFRKKIAKRIHDAPELFNNRLWRVSSDSEAKDKTMTVYEAFAKSQLITYGSR